LAKDIYKKLAKHLDDLPGGYPSTKSGVELRILKRLFTPEEAALAVKVTLMPEEPETIAGRAKLPVQETAEQLEEMAGKGLLYRFERKGRPHRYMAAQFVIGIWEYHVNSLDKGLIQDFNEYAPYLILPEDWKKRPQLRTVPVERSLDTNLQAFPYENARKLVESHTKFLEAPCICRKEHKMMDKGCDKPEGNCLIMGGAADYYKRNGLGREITREEALGLLKKADETGLVLQPSYAKNIANICCCCGCCCQVLAAIKRHPRPAELVVSPYFTKLDQESCTGCEVCVDRCQMDAIFMDGDKAVLKTEHCIGCGLCVTTCPANALTLERKPEAEQVKVPDNLVKAAVQSLRSRKKYDPVFLVRMLIKLISWKRKKIKI